ncbi:MAG: ABC transporter permease [Oscillospiraceae bacterium]|nr:ABC transporter permease [Oscillospiraceae bacterium]
MINIYYQLVHSLKCIFKDTKPLISKILTFSLVILVLGSAFSDMFDTNIEPVKVGILNEDKGALSTGIIQVLEPLGTLDPEAEATQAEEDEENTEDENATADVSIGEWMKVYNVESEEDGRALACDDEVADENRISAMIHFPEGFTDKVTENADKSDGEATPITIKTGRSTQVDTTVVKCVFDTFTNSLNADFAVQEHFDGKSLPQDLDIENGYTQMETDAEATPDAMSYYAIAMLMMVLLYGAEYGCNSIADDYLGVIGERIKTTPIKRYQQYIGKMLGMVIATTLQGIFIVLLTGLVYGAKWGSNYLALLAIIFSMSAASVTLGACLCMITRNGARGQAMVSLIVIACTFLAGGFVKMDMGALKYISPNYYAQTAMFNSIYNGDTGIALQNIGILWLFVIGASAIAILMSRRKRA